LGFLKSVSRWLSFSPGSFGGAPGGVHPSRRRVIHVEEHQAELAAIAGAQKESGHPLPVLIELRSDPEAPWGQCRMQCWIEGRLVGHMDGDNALRLMQKVVTGERSDEPVSLDGYIIGDSSRDNGPDARRFEVVFKEQWDLPKLDDDVEELLRMED
jgi:hypothetical protein